MRWLATGELYEIWLKVYIGGILSEERRTINGTESFHSHFNEQFYGSHPTIFIFNELYLAVTTFNYLNYP